MNAPHELALLQQAFDEEGAALVIRKFRAPSLRADLPALDGPRDLRGALFAVTLFLSALFAIAMVSA